MQAFARFFRVFGPIALAAAVGLDAWHAHGLKTSLDAEAYASFGRALDQQYILGLALCLAGWRADSKAGNRGHLVAGLVFLFALLAFCGDVYLGALGYRHPGIAPQGGSAHILAWLIFAGAEALAARSK
jgi:uncharacterized membrane protein YgdD (TMEM256/DUF423 family)